MRQRSNTCRLTKPTVSPLVPTSHSASANSTVLLLLLLHSLLLLLLLHPLLLLPLLLRWTSQPTIDALQRRMHHTLSCLNGNCAFLRLSEGTRLMLGELVT